MSFGRTTEAEGQSSRPKAESGEEFLGRSSEPPPHQLGVKGSAVSSPSKI